MLYVRDVKGGRIPPIGGYTLPCVRCVKEENPPNRGYASRVVRPIYKKKKIANKVKKKNLPCYNSHA